MATPYYPLRIALMDGRKGNLRKAFPAKTAVTLRVKPNQIGRGDELLLTATQINRLKKASAERRGADLRFSKIQITKNAQRGCNLFSTVPSLARPLLALAAKALATAGLSFGAERCLKRFSGKGTDLRRSDFTNLYRRCPLDKRKQLKSFLSVKEWSTEKALQNTGNF